MPLYSHEFQREVLYTLANNVIFATNYGCLLQDNSFDLAPMKVLYNIINKYMLQYEVELERKDLFILVEDYVSSKGWGSESLKVFKDEVREIYASIPKNEDFVSAKVVQFIRKQALKDAIEDSIIILETGDDYEPVLKKIDKAISIGTGLQETKTLKDLMDLPQKYRERYDPKTLIKTGFRRFDAALAGGLAPGELHIFIGPPGSGKSTFGCNIGAYNIGIGKNVFHASLENKDLDVMKHYALRLTGLSHTEFLTVDNVTWRKKMERVNKFKDTLFVGYWPEKTANTLTLRAWIAHHRSSFGINPDLIIIDYDDCLVPVGGGNNDMYEDAGAIYSDMIQLADYFKCFPGDTEIMTNGLTVRFDQLKKNDIIRINCLQHGTLREVSAIALGEVGRTNKLMKIAFDAGMYEATSTIRCTLDHKIMLADNNEMKEAQYLKIGDEVVALTSYANLFKSTKTITSIEIETLDKEIPVYCLSVPVIGNFALGNGVIVSNCPIISFAQPKRDAWAKAEGEIIMSNDLAHSAKKAHKAYSVSSLNFKKGEKKGKLYIDKCRRGEDNVFIDLERDLSRSYFGEKDKGTMYDD